MIEILLMIYIIDINSKIEIRVVDVAAVGLPVNNFFFFLMMVMVMLPELKIVIMDLLL